MCVCARTRVFEARTILRVNSDKQISTLTSPNAHALAFWASKHCSYLLPEGSRVLSVNGMDAGALTKTELQELLVTSLTLTITLMPALPPMGEVSFPRLLTPPLLQLSLVADAVC